MKSLNLLASKSVSIANMPEGHICFSFSESYFGMKKDEKKIMHKQYPWLLCLEVEAKFEASTEDALYEFSVQNGIETLLENAVRKNVEFHKVISLIHNKILRHYWYIDRAIEVQNKDLIKLWQELKGWRNLDVFLVSDEKWNHIKPFQPSSHDETPPFEIEK